MTALDFGARALALRAGAHAPRTFTTLAASALNEQIERIESVGHAQKGHGAATYVCDTKADAALMAAYPAAVFPAAGGRHFRLLGTPDGYVTPEMLGCPPYEPGVNQQPYIQAAVNYCIAVGLQGVKFPQATYELWAPLRTGYAQGNGYDNTNHTGNFIVIDGGAISLVGQNPRRTRLHCKGPNGGSLATDYQVVPVTSYGGDVIWRGAALKLTGNTSAYTTRQPDDALSHVTLRDLIFFSDAVGVRNTNWPARAASHPSGARENCWDVSNKGIYVQQDKQVGDILVENVDIIGFLGEAFYTAGTFQSPDQTVGSQVRLRNCTVKHTNAQALNPNGPLVFDVAGFRAENCGFGFEGWGGAGFSRIVNAYFRDCGACGAGGSNTYDNPLRTDGTQPICIVDIVCENCGGFNVGSYLQGKLNLIDTSVALVSLSDTMEIKNNNLDITLQVHGKSLNEAIRYSGRSTAGLKTIANNVIRLNVIRTKEATAAGYWTTSLVTQSGSLGQGNYLFLRGYAGTIGSATAVSDNYVAIIDEGIQSQWGSFGTVFDPPLTPSPDMGSGWMRAATFSNPSTSINVNLPATTMYQQNAEIVVEHRDAAAATKTMILRDAGVERAVIGYKMLAKFRCNKARTQWELVNLVPAIKATASIDITATEAGAESGPYSIPASGCRGHFRASVTAGQGASLPQGFVISAVRAETDAVKFWLRNIDAGAQADPAAQSFTASYALP